MRCLSSPLRTRYSLLVWNVGMRKCLSIIATLSLAANAQAVRIADVTWISGQRTNVLTGMGLVVGLKGTGDGGKYEAAIRPLAQMLAKMGNQTILEELKETKNVAIVAITARMPEQGARNGEQLDVRVNSIGAAQSLRGGRLYVTPLLGPTQELFVAQSRGADGRVYEDKLPFALAEGAILVEDPTVPTVATIRKGATMEVDLPTEQIDRAGRVTLVIEDPSASWTMASLIAKTINGEKSADVAGGGAVAVAIDPKNVVVTVPPEERGQPDNFIASIQNLDLPMLPGEARVVINEKTGTMILTGDVEISPVVVSHKGLTISTVTPAPVPQPGLPLIKTTDFVPVATGRNRAGRLQDLLDALDQLKVPADDKIAIVKELYKSGKLHAKLIVE